MKGFISRLARHGATNFVLTNRIPRRTLTRAFGWFSRIENPLVCAASLAAWRLFTDLDLSEARDTHFRSLHAVFTRELKPGARPADPDPSVIASPCDGIVGACGPINGESVFQAKGFTYSLGDLLCDPELAGMHRDGCYATLRLTSAMYHHFHAPCDCTVRRTTYVPGDVWNVNPPTLERVPRLFCRNERAVIRAEMADGLGLTLVPVAAVLVASLRLRYADVRLHLGYRGPAEIVSDAALRKGQPMGWFEHGSTILVFAPAGVRLADGIATGAQLRAGEPLMRLPGRDATEDQSR